MCSSVCASVANPIYNYASKFVEKETVKKHYFIDNGLLNIFLTDSDTSLLENLCALTLYRESVDDEDKKVYYYNKELELDFFIPSEKRAIQVSYSLKDPSTEEREVKALIKIHDLYGVDKAEIVTYSEEKTIEKRGLTIQVIPLSKWLLSHSS